MKNVLHQKLIQVAFSTVVVEIALAAYYFPEASNFLNSLPSLFGTGENVEKFDELAECVLISYIIYRLAMSLPLAFMASLFATKVTNWLVSIEVLTPMLGELQKSLSVFAVTFLTGFTISGIYILKVNGMRLSQFTLVAPEAIFLSLWLSGISAVIYICWSCLAGRSD